MGVTQTQTINVEDWIGRVYVGDCLDVAGAWPSGRAQLILTSPPYNAGIDYGEGSNDALPWSEYEAWAAQWIGMAKRLLCDGGRLAIVVAAGIGRSPWYPLAATYQQAARAWGLLPRAEIVWDKGPSRNNSTAWGSWCSPSNPQIRDSHEAILVFSKGEWSLPNPCSVDSDLRPEEFPDLTRSLWRVPCETDRSHPAPFPERLAERLIKLYTWPGDLVLDPFLGSGTTAVVCERLKRRWIGCEINPEYAALAEKRIQQERDKLQFDFDGRGAAGGATGGG